MTQGEGLRCDGCGQAASPEHVARRLQRLEWSTRFRPVHIGTLLLGAAAPANDSEFLYSPIDLHAGEAQTILEASGISAAGKPADGVLAEFQRAGLFLAHVLECPAEDARPETLPLLLEKQLPAAMTRIRRSLRPKRLAVISTSLAPYLAALQAGNLGCELFLDGGKPFAPEHQGGTARLAEALRAGRAARLTAV